MYLLQGITIKSKNGIGLRCFRQTFLFLKMRIQSLLQQQRRTLRKLNFDPQVYEDGLIKQGFSQEQAQSLVTFVDMDFISAESLR